MSGGAKSRRVALTIGEETTMHANLSSAVGSLLERLSGGHAHRAMPDATEERPYSAPVALPGREVPRAHGGVERRERCRCGAVRRVNLNAGAAEVGPWEGGEQ